MRPRPDLSTVDELARLVLAARRLGVGLLFTGVDPDLRDLLCLTGLGQLVVEVGREAELGEEVGVEEVVQPRDPTV